MKRFLMGLVVAAGLAFGGAAQAHDRPAKPGQSKMIAGPGEPSI